MYFIIKDDGLLKKYNVIWDKVSNIIKIEFDSKPIYNKIFLKTKIKFYREGSTDFYDKEMPKVGAKCTCLAVILINFVLKKCLNYYPQVFKKNVNTLKKKKNNIIYC